MTVGRARFRQTVNDCAVRSQTFPPLQNPLGICAQDDSEIGGPRL
jgi:hypothetical protein